MDDETDLRDLNQKLLEEIGTIQIRMIDVLRDNFRLKTELDTLKRYMRRKGLVPTPFVVPRQPRRREDEPRPSSRRPIDMSSDHYSRPHPVSESRLADNALDLYSRSYGEETLVQQVADMDRVISELDMKTRCHEVTSIPEEQQSESQGDNPAIPPFPEFTTSISAGIPETRRSSVQALRSATSTSQVSRRSSVQTVGGESETAKTPEESVLRQSLPRPTSVNNFARGGVTPSDDGNRSVPPEEVSDDLPSLIPQFKSSSTMIQSMRR
jgi:hypothetical protein